MDTASGPGEFSESQRAGLEVRQADQDRTLAGMHRLEAMLAAAAPGREQDWRSDVLAALVDLDEAYEAYFDAFRADLAAEADRWPTDPAGKPLIRERAAR